MARVKVSFHSSLLTWRLALIALTLLCLALLGIIWFSGAAETRHAVDDGRRLLIDMYSGEVQGKIIASEPQAPAPAPETSTPTASNTAEQPADAASDNVAASDTANAEAQPEIPVVDEPEDTVASTTPLTPSISPPPVASPALMEKTDQGNLPRIGGDGVKPWKYYAKPYIRKGTKPMIAIVITGLGASKQISDLALRLPEPVALSFSPYAKDLNSWTSSARFTGHELLLDLPMEPTNYPAADPGPYALLISKDQQSNEARLKKIMTSTSGYLGFLTPQDEVFSSNNDLFRALLQSLSGRGLMLLVGKPPPKTDTKDMLEGGTTANIIADTLIDEELTPTAIQARLTLLEQIAKQRGYAVGIGQAYPLTIQELSDWAAKLDEAGFTLVPISLIIMQRYS